MYIFKNRPLPPPDKGARIKKVIPEVLEKQRNTGTPVKNDTGARLDIFFLTGFSGWPWSSSADRVRSFNGFDWHEL